MIQLDYIQNEFIVFPGGHEGERFLPADMSDKVVADLTKSEEQSINYVIESLGNLNSTKLSSISHSEPAWIENKDNNGSINYEYGFDLNAI